MSSDELKDLKWEIDNIGPMELTQARRLMSKTVSILLQEVIELKKEKEEKEKINER